MDEKLSLYLKKELLQREMNSTTTAETREIWVPADLRPFIDTRDVERKTHDIARYQTRFPRANLNEERLWSVHTELLEMDFLALVDICMNREFANFRHRYCQELKKDPKYEIFNVRKDGISLNSITSMLKLIKMTSCT